MLRRGCYTNRSHEEIKRPVQLQTRRSLQQQQQQQQHPAAAVAAAATAVPRHREPFHGAGAAANFPLITVQCVLRALAAVAKLVSAIASRGIAARESALRAGRPRV